MFFLITSLHHFFTQPAGVGAPMMPQPMMGQPMMRPQFTGPAAPGAPVNNLFSNTHTEQTLSILDLDLD